MENILIRRAGVADVPALSRLASETFYDTFTGTCTSQDMETFLHEYFNHEQVRKELSDPDDYFFVALIGHDFVGYVRLKEDLSNVETIDKYKGIELKRLYVKKELFSKRVGAQLMVYAIDFAKQKGYEMVWLGVWEFNHRAKNFYTKFGFKYTGFTHPFPIGSTPQTDEWMVRFL